MACAPQTERPRGVALLSALVLGACGAAGGGGPPVGLSGQRAEAAPEPAEVAGVFRCAVESDPGHDADIEVVRLDPDRQRALFCGPSGQRCEAPVPLSVHGHEVAISGAGAFYELEALGGDAVRLSGHARRAEHEVSVACERQGDLPPGAEAAAPGEEVEVADTDVPPAIADDLRAMLAGIARFYQLTHQQPGEEEVTTHAFPTVGPPHPAEPFCGVASFASPPDWAEEIGFTPARVRARYGLRVDPAERSVRLWAAVDSDCDGREAVFALDARDPGDGQLYRAGGFRAVDPTE